MGERALLRGFAGDCHGLWGRGRLGGKWRKGGRGEREGEGEGGVLGEAMFGA